MASPVFTIVTFGDRFLVESDQYKPDPTLPNNARTCLLLTSRGTLAKSGDSWATRKAAEAAIERFNAKRRGDHKGEPDWLGLAQAFNKSIEDNTQLYPGEIVDLLHKHGMVKAQHPEVITWAKVADKAAKRGS